MMTDESCNVLIHELGQELFLMRLNVSAMTSDLALEQEHTIKSLELLAQSIERATHCLQALVQITTK
jgi:hypothetical protein